MRIFLRSATIVATIVLGYGFAEAETSVLLDVDFSEKCTAGSENAPQMFKYSNEFSQLGLTGWSISPATGVGQAGGSLYINDGASVRTGNLSISPANGGVKVTLVVKLNKTDMGMAQLQWGYSITENAEINSGEWTTVEYIVTPGTTSNFAKISPFLVADGIFLKSVKIEQGKEFLGVPVPSLPSDANGTSFTARWKAVSGATKYYLDVYSYGADNKKIMFLENQEVTPTSSSYISYKVEGLNPEITYYYTIRAANETAVSGNSEEIEVIKVISALNKPAVSVSASSDGSYTATWGAVADAESYFVNVLCRKTLAEAGSADMLTESFDCFTTGTIENFEYAYDRHLEMLGEKGWTGKDMLYFKGGMGLTPYSANESYIATPVMDLSSDNGKVTVILTAAATKNRVLSTDGALKLALEDAEGNLSEPVELKLNVSGFHTYTVNLTGGTAASKVKIYDFNGETSFRYFFDDITVKQVKPAGYVTTSTYKTAEVETTSFTGSIEKEDNAAYYVTITAAARTVDGGNVGVIYSAPSDEALIAEFSGVEDMTIGTEDTVTFRSVGNGMIEVTAATDTIVEIYDLSGRKIMNTTVSSGINTLRVNASGVVIVKAGAVARKLAL